jgi:hypothetical protein
MVRLWIISTIFFIISACANSNRDLNMRLSFTNAKKLTDYPSGSTISYFENQLYLMGDDASSLIMLDTSLNLVQSVALFSSSQKRIKKSDKADIESSEWVDSKLWLFGSGSLSPQRDSAYHFEPGTKKIVKHNIAKLYSTLRSRITDLNIEGSALVKNDFLFASRSNLKSNQNYIIKTTSSNFLSTVDPHIIALELPNNAGISGMAYVEQADILLFTASRENTISAYDDGSIEESYFGTIYNISEKLNETLLYPDDWIPLSKVHSAFNKQKAESVCSLPPSGDIVPVIIVSDNDDGETQLFRLHLDLKK